MSSSPNGASVPHNPNIEWALLSHPPEPEVEEPSDLEDTSKEEYDHVYGPAVEATGTNKPDHVPAQVEDQFNHPTEEPEEFDMEKVRAKGLTGFMAKVANRLRSLQTGQERSRARHAFNDLMIRLKTYDKTQPYSQKVAEEVQQFLVERGLGESLLVDFNMLLDVMDDRAQKHREETETRKQTMENERRKKQEWDTIQKAEAEEEWELLY